MKNIIKLSHKMDRLNEESCKYDLRDVELVMNVSKSSFDKALDALEKSNGDIVVAACLLTH
jgi:NACalpha-BTF3-like transcription factor